MTTIGKILVGLNLLFALVMGWFVVSDYFTRTNWKRGYDKLEMDYTNARATADASNKAYTETLDKYTKAMAAQDSIQINRKGAESDLTLALEREKKLAKTQQALAEEAILNLQKEIAEKKRLLEEVKLQVGIVKIREDQIIKMQQDVGTFRSEALQAQNEARSAIARSQQLVKQVQELEQSLARAKQGPTAGPTTVSVRDPNYKNPPPVYVKGEITKIHPEDRGMVQLSVGSDVGLNVDHTLDVYRVGPRPEYLGQVRILQVDTHHAFARLMPANGVARPSPLQVGDEVASKIQNRP